MGAPLISTESYGEIEVLKTGKRWENGGIEGAEELEEIRETEAESWRKREKRLRAIRREMVDPIYEKKEAAKQAALEAALAAPKLPVRVPGANSMDTAAASTPDIPIQGDDVEMEDASQKKAALKPMGKKMKKKLKIAKKRGHCKGKLRRKHV